jgi:predicted O-methyltransferase YrrM
MVEHDPVAGMSIPPLVKRAMEAAQANGFDQSCTVSTGRLLMALAATVDGSILEIGTGCGVGAAWMATASKASITTVEQDERLASIASELFDQHDGVTVVPGSLPDVWARDSFDLIFVDVAEYKDNGSQILEALSPRGTVVLDDFTPEWMKGDEWAGVVDDRRNYWLEHPQLIATEVLTTSSQSVLICVKRHDA